MCDACNDAALPFATPASGYFRGCGVELTYVGKSADIAVLTVPSRLPADAPALAVDTGAGLRLMRLWGSEDPLARARHLVATSHRPVAVGRITHIGTEGDMPISLLKVDRVVRPLPDIEALYQEELPAVTGALGSAVEVAKAALDPLNTNDFDRIVSALSKMVTTTSGAIEQRALESWLNSLKFDWTTATDAELRAASVSLNRAMRKVGSGVWVGVRGQLNVTAQRTATSTRKSDIRRHKIKVSSRFKAKDRAAVNRVVDTNAHFIRDFYGGVSAPLSAQMRNIVQMGLSEGLTDFEISDMLRSQMGAKLGVMSGSYLNVVSSAVVGRSRSYSQLTTYNDAGYDRYLIEAILDEVTTPFCRLVHGTEFSVARGLQRYAAADKLKDPTDVHYEMPWVTERLIKQGDDEGKKGIYIPGREEMIRVAVIEQSAYGEKDKIGTFSSTMSPATMEKNNIGPPPYHGRCRTRLLPPV